LLYIFFCEGYPDNECSKNGKCIETDDRPKCECNTGFTGPTCNSIDASSSSITENNDTTITENNNDTTTSLSNLCPGGLLQCEGHGNCINGVCQCNEIWEGPTCANRICKEHNGSECNNRGICTGNDTFSYCNCSGAYFGDACQYVSELYCPNNCSGHKCKIDTLLPSCDCPLGVTGMDCSITNSNYSEDKNILVPVLVITAICVVVVIVIVIVMVVPGTRNAIFPNRRVREKIKERVRKNL